MKRTDEKVVLELFSGSKAVSGVFEKKGWRSVNVDNNAALSPSICCDILDLQRGQLPERVGFIWASPVCTNFSRAAKQSNWKKTTIAYRRYSYEPLTATAQLSLDMLAKTMEILSWFPGVSFVIENPIGRITHTAAMQRLGHYRYFVNYHDFGFSYSKETYLFSNLWLPFRTKKYKVSAPGLRSVRSTFERSKVPPKLVETILNYGEDQIRSRSNSYSQ